MAQTLKPTIGTASKVSNASGVTDVKGRTPVSISHHSNMVDDNGKPLYGVLHSDNTIVYVSEDKLKTI